ncbi:acetylcholine receptor subunit alpha-like 1 [Watersipora subatra]|uniref:acetylcholine receptor subunit alpha-like 1 n=1 Tax=Watersipora subatra TaxID=2589382 RepID=UPI00355AD094
MTDTDEQRLLRSLMTNYEKAVRPVMKASDPITLKIGLTMNQIDVVEKNQVLSALVWLDQEWSDEKLVWNPKDYNNLEVIRIPCSLIWLPDIVLYNSVEDMKGGYMQALAMVSHTGNVFWPPIVKFNGACEITIKYFPFDDQQCKLKLGTWSYDVYQVNLTKRRNGIDLKNYQENGEWKLTHTKVVRNEVRYACCDAPQIDITFYVYMQRRTLYYTYNIIIPCVMLSILTLLCFWMKPDSGEKISLGLTILLAFSVFMLLIAEDMPSTSVNVPIIGIYISSSMCITAFSVIVGVIVANVNHQADGDRQVPYWVHRICYTLSKVTCLKMPSYEERHYNIKMLALRSQVVLPSAIVSKRKPSSRRRKSVANRTEELRNEVRNGSFNLAEAHLAQAENRKLNERTSKGNEEESSGEVDPLLQRLHSIVQHQEELLQKQNTTEDWHLVAIVIDRCLFWLYLLMMLSTTVGCLVIFPLTNDVELDDDVIPATSP